MGLSVVLCTYDGARWLPAFLDSLAQQERLPDELVVHDDASGDATVAVVEAFAERAPFPVQLHPNRDRLGSTGNFGRALADSRGRVVALADQDDIWYPAKLRRICEEFDTDPTVSMVFCNADLVGEDDRRLDGDLWDTRLVGRTLRRHSVVPEELFARRALTTGCTMAVRRRVIDAALPFPPELDDPRGQMRHDRWLSLVAAAVGTVRALPDHLLAFRVHPAQETGVLVGSQLPRQLGRAALALGGGADHTAEHRARARQLEQAAERAELVGDFKEAATLRDVAVHRRRRSLVGRNGHGPLTVLRQATGGEYRGDPLAWAAVAADLIRACRSRPPHAPT